MKIVYTSSSLTITVDNDESFNELLEDLSDKSSDIQNLSIEEISDEQLQKLAKVINDNDKMNLLKKGSFSQFLALEKRLEVQEARINADYQKKLDVVNKAIFKEKNELNEKIKKTKGARQMEMALPELEKAIENKHFTSIESGTKVYEEITKQVKFIHNFNKKLLATQRAAQQKQARDAEILAESIEPLKLKTSYDIPKNLQDKYKMSKVVDRFKWTDILHERFQKSIEDYINTSKGKKQDGSINALKFLEYIDRLVKQKIVDPVHQELILLGAIHYFQFAFEEDKILQEILERRENMIKQSLSNGGVRISDEAALKAEAHRVFHEAFTEVISRINDVDFGKKTGLVRTIVKETEQLMHENILKEPKISEDLDKAYAKFESLEKEEKLKAQEQSRLQDIKIPIQLPEKLSDVYEILGISSEYSSRKTRELPNSAVLKRFKSDAEGVIQFRDKNFSEVLESLSRMNNALEQKSITHFDLEMTKEFNDSKTLLRGLKNNLTRLVEEPHHRALVLLGAINFLLQNYETNALMDEISVLEKQRTKLMAIMDSSGESPATIEENAEKAFRVVVNDPEARTLLGISEKRFSEIKSSDISMMNISELRLEHEKQMKEYHAKLEKLIKENIKPTLTRKMTQEEFESRKKTLENKFVPKIKKIKEKWGLKENEEKELKEKEERKRKRRELNEEVLLSTEDLVELDPAVEKLGRELEKRLFDYIDKKGKEIFEEMERKTMMPEFRIDKTKKMKLAQETYRALFDKDGNLKPKINVATELKRFDEMDKQIREKSGFWHANVKGELGAIFSDFEEKFKKVQPPPKKTPEKPHLKRK